MKLGRSFLLATLAAFIITLYAFPAMAASSWRLSNQLPPSHFISKGMDFFAEKVSEYSNGEMKVEVFHSAQLFKDTEIVEAIQEGLVELALVPVNKWSGMVPAADIFEMPFVFKDLSSPKKFIEAGAGEILDNEFQAKGAKVVFWVDYGLVQFYNNKRPLAKPADFDGLKIRTFSKGTADTVKALGGIPAVMSSSEMYMALQRGTVDGATTGMPAAVSRKIYEVQKYMTLANYTTAQFFVQGNFEWWDSLSDKEKEVLLKAGADAAESIRGSIADSEDKAYNVIKDGGVEIYALNDEERAAFVKATESVRSEFMQQTGEISHKLMEILESID
ncbi:MAG: DctP family TRAP transporter solute-binding subunit [Aminobacterium sp.]|uniref:DctP family TRAP transporter solute-binding subunit n=1 Tax=Aminobacterium sp. TaxID=1872491 RepID=UPI001BCDF5E0|nr:DctP family TRAP transporter solute-binding subunit [Aminobacterium sp.]MDD2247619.1 DctP family TRAP transporter solute-binding subunit [Proteiniphilum sp.]MDD4229736.1 DctP family TRAP transporter solute-binding subunit [Aminobacterium sp.]MEA4876705.1 DctP family TRAP transporter solute-binding subunit [Aminobacterium sp.]